MTLADQIEAYSAALLPWLGEPGVYEGVAALLARDAADRWWERPC